MRNSTNYKPGSALRKYPCLALNPFNSYGAKVFPSLVASQLLSEARPRGANGARARCAHARAARAAALQSFSRSAKLFPLCQEAPGGLEARLTVLASLALRCSLRSPYGARFARFPALQSFSRSAKRFPLCKYCLALRAALVNPSHNWMLQESRLLDLDALGIQSRSLQEPSGASRSIQSRKRMSWQFANPPITYKSLPAILDIKIQQSGLTRQNLRASRAFRLILMEPSFSYSRRILA